MNRTLDRYINCVRCWELPSGKKEWTFHGDGQGDFEEIAENVSEKLIKDYLKHLDEQKKLAKQYLKELKDGQS